MILDIVMPFYGDGQMFREAVESVLSQDDARWHLTVIDDANPDNAPGEWLASLDNPQVDYIRNPKNLGVAASFQRAVEIASRDALCIMGCDDLLMPGFVANALERLAESESIAYIQPGVRVIDAEGRAYSPLGDRVKRALRPRGSQVLHGEDAARRLLTGNWTYFPSIVWRTSAVKSRPFDQRYEVVLDLDLQLRLLSQGGDLAVDDRVTFAYRRHRGSVSSITARDGARFREEKQLFAEWAGKFREMGWSKAERAARIHITSRLNAFTLLPGARHDRYLRRALVQHIIGKDIET